MMHWVSSRPSSSRCNTEQTFYDSVYVTNIEMAMHFLVTPMREFGVARLWPEIRASAPVRGDLRVNNEMCEAMNRTSNVARVHVGMRLDADPLTELLDAFMSGMATNAFTMSGVELVDSVLYAQSGWCREI